MRHAALLLIVSALPGCAVASQQAAAPAAQATQANVPEHSIAPDSVARLKLVDLSSVVRGVRFELRYATTDNFTGAVLPGYGAARPLFRREGAIALQQVERELEARGYALKVWDAYRPVRATLGMVAWCEANHRTDLLDQGYIAR